MIGALVAWAMLQEPTVFPNVRVIPSSGQVVRIQALIGIPPRLTDEEIGALRTLVQSQVTESSDFGPTKLLELCSGGGKPRAEVMEDHIRIWLTVNRVDLRIGVKLMASVLNHPRLDDPESMGTAAESLDSKNPVYWQQLLVPKRYPYLPYNPEMIKALHQKVYIPTNVSLCFGGDISAEEVLPLVAGEWKEELWGQKFAYRQRFTKAKEWTRPNAQATLVSLNSGAYTATTDIDLALATSMVLGLGKGGAVFRVLRSQVGLSYRQETYLWPDERGFRLRSAFATLPKDNESTLPDQAKQALLTDVESWTQEDLDRAFALGQSALEGEYDQCPIGFRPNGGNLQQSGEREFMSLYWPYKTGTQWDPGLIMTRLRSLPLDRVKTFATKSINESTSWMLSGR